LSKQEFHILAVRYPRQLHANTALTTLYFFLNTRVAPFDDVRVRRAVNMAFDRETFARLVGNAAVPTCQILPPNLPGYRSTCQLPRGGFRDVESARRLVRSSGTAGAQVTVWTPSRRADEGRYLVAVLDSLGYRAGLKTVDDPDVYFTTVSDSRVRAQAGWGAWAADVPSAAGFVPGLFSCAAFVPASRQNNLAEFCDRSVDAQIARAAAAQVQDPAAATSLWQEVERMLLAQAPVVPTYNPSNVNFVSKRVGNYQYNPQWGVLLDQLWVR
jgi:peptide/nickel transport system substrate-binding protein